MWSEQGERMRGGIGWMDEVKSAGAGGWPPRDKRERKSDTYLELDNGAPLRLGQHVTEVVLERARRVYLCVRERVFRYEATCRSPEEQRLISAAGFQVEPRVGSGRYAAPLPPPPHMSPSAGAAQPTLRMLMLSRETCA